MKRKESIEILSTFEILLILGIILRKLQQEEVYRTVHLLKERNTLYLSFSKNSSEMNKIMQSSCFSIHFDSECIPLDKILFRKSVPQLFDFLKIILVLILFII